MTKLLLLLFFFFSLSNLSAQRDTIHLKRTGKEEAVVTDRPPQAVYFQLGGSAPIFAFNYDRRFSKRLNGPGFAIGAGWFGGGGTSLFSVPASINYLIGRKNNFFELAAGLTYITGNFEFFDNNQVDGTFYHINVGFRHQPANGGFFFRGGFSPLFVEGGMGPSFYLGFGTNF